MFQIVEPLDGDIMKWQDEKKLIRILEIIQLYFYLYFTLKHLRNAAKEYPGIGDWELALGNKAEYTGDEYCLKLSFYLWPLHGFGNV